MSITTVATPAALAALLDGRSDEDINALVAEPGAAAVVGRMFELMAQAFVPDRAAGQTATAQWEVTAPDGPHTFHVIIENGTCRAGAGPAPSPPRITLGIGLADFLRFMAGEGNAMTAFMAGKLKVSGDVMFGPVMEGFFDRS
jgi:putative sterol carrier protein